MKIALFSGSFPNRWHFCKLPHSQSHKLTREKRGGIDLGDPSPLLNRLKLQNFNFLEGLIFKKIQKLSKFEARAESQITITDSRSTARLDHLKDQRSYAEVKRKCGFLFWVNRSFPSRRGESARKCSQPSRQAVAHQLENFQSQEKLEKSLNMSSIID